MEDRRMEAFTFSKQQIIDAATTWKGFNGFSGETCRECKKTANVLAGGIGWECICGYYNGSLMGAANPTHENPDLGPASALITEAYAEARPKGE